MQTIRLHSHLLLNPDEISREQLDTLLQNEIPLAFLFLDGNEEQLSSVIDKLPKRYLPVLVVSIGKQFAETSSNAEIFALKESDLDKVSIAEPVETARQKLSCSKLVWMVNLHDSLLTTKPFFRFWETTGKMPNFIQATRQNFRQMSKIVSILNRQPKIFGVVQNGQDLLTNVLWKDYPDRVTNGYFSFPVDSVTSFPFSPYKAGYQFSPDIILPSPENLRNQKVFNAFALDPDFELTDQFSFSKKIRNLKRKNDSEIIPYGVEFVTDKTRGSCMFFSGKAYLDGGLQSRTALKPSFSITAWIKPTELGGNNCILGKGKDFVLKIHDGLLTFTVQGIKDYFSVKTPIPLNKWSFIGLVHDEPSNRISFYLNGKLTETMRLLKTYSESEYTMLIGSNLWEEFFVGYMGEIKIWNRELNENEIRMEYISQNQTDELHFLSWFVLLILISSVSGFYTWRHLFCKKKAGIPKGELLPSTNIRKSLAFVNSPETQEKILCFGGLKVITKEGKDLGLKFSPKIKQLFVLILLHSIGGQKGISSKKISDCLWPGASPQNAKNIRGTNIQNLKALLLPCKGIRLVFQEKLWMFEFTDGFFIDYDFVESQLNEPMFSNMEAFMKELPVLLSILKTGTLFPNMSESWVDPYINRMSNRIIEFGQKLFLELAEEKFDSVVLDIAEVISINDPLNESALCKKINILTRQGKLSFARSVFDNFTKLYFELYKEKYPDNYKTLVAGGTSQ